MTFASVAENMFAGQYVQEKPQQRTVLPGQDVLDSLYRMLMVNSSDGKMPSMHGEGIPHHTYINSNTSYWS